MVIQKLNTMDWLYVGRCKHTGTAENGKVFEVGNYDYLFIADNGTVKSLRKSIANKQIKKG